MITRAIGLLVVVGDPNTLFTDDNWKEFVKYCFDNNAIVSSEEI